MLKRVLTIIIATFLVVWAVLLLTGRTIIIPLSEYKTKSDSTLNIGDKVNPIKKYNFDEGNWKAFLVFSSTDIKELPNSFRSANCLKTKNVDILKSMQQEWEFEYKGVDIATVESKLLIFKDGDLVYETGIVLSNAIEGLQNNETGWLDGSEGKKLSKYFQKFKRVYSPIIIL